MFVRIVVDCALGFVFLIGFVLFLSGGPALQQFQGAVIMLVATLVIGFSTVTRAVAGLRSDLAAALRQ
jgi:hypothetical protein